MGPLPKVKLPPRIKRFVDRHGVARHYHRPTGSALPGLPYSPEFMAAYAAAETGQPVQKAEGAAPAAPGTIRSLVIGFLNSDAFAQGARKSRENHRTSTAWLLKECGDYRIAKLTRKHVIDILGAIASPHVRNARLKTIRSLVKHAIAKELLTDDPTLGIKKLSVARADADDDEQGHHTWEEHEIAQFKARWPVGTQERKALTILLCTAQRRSDIVRLGRQHLRGGLLTFKQIKGGAKGSNMELPILPELQALIDGEGDRIGPFLLSPAGKPFQPEHFSRWFREACNAANLPNCSAHGLRKAAAVRFAEAGATPHQIMAWTGHKTLSEVERYTKMASQRKNAAAAMAKLLAVVQS